MAMSPWKERTAFWSARDAAMMQRKALDAEWSGHNPYCAPNPYLEPGRPYTGPQVQYVLSSTSAEEFHSRISALEQQLELINEINRELVEQVMQLQAERTTRRN